VIFLGDFLSSWLKEAQDALPRRYVRDLHLFSPEGLTKIVSDLSASGY
jgi:hypothetical protein